MDGPPANAFSGKMKTAQPLLPDSLSAKPVLYLFCPAAPLVALPYLTKGDTFDSQRALPAKHTLHLETGEFSFFFGLWLGGGD